MKKENSLQLIGITAFLVISILTYGVVTPVSETKTTSFENVTNKITSTTNTTTNTTADSIDDTSRIANNYHILTAITAGVVIAIVIVFFLGFW